MRSLNCVNFTCKRPCHSVPTVEVALVCLTKSPLALPYPPLSFAVGIRHCSEATSYRGIPTRETQMVMVASRWARTAATVVNFGVPSLLNDAGTLLLFATGFYRSTDGYHVSQTSAFTRLLFLLLVIWIFTAVAFSEVQHARIQRRDFASEVACDSYELQNTREVGGCATSLW